MPIVTLTTDFGLEDEYVGVMKGSLLSVNPQVTLIDISHAILPQDVESAALMLSYAYPYFPEGTIHVVVVDPGVGGDRGIIALENKGHIFLAPDNGALSLICDESFQNKVCSVTNQTLFRHPVSSTFHGRDIFAPVAAHLSKGFKLSALGEMQPAGSMVRLTIKSAVVDKGRQVIEGAMLSFDRFGNILTNIHQSMLESFDNNKQLVFRIGGETIKGIDNSYQNAGQKRPLAIIGSRRFIEISVNQGSAKDYFSAQKYDPVTLTFSS